MATDLLCYHTLSSSTFILSRDYEIYSLVTVRRLRSDLGSHDHVTFNVGTAANVVATGLAGQPPRPPPPSYVAGATDKDDDKKNGAKVTIEDLDKMDKKLDQKARDGPLLRHWFDFSFYLMASLSVVLPVLFLGTYSFAVA